MTKQEQIEIHISILEGQVDDLQQQIESLEHKLEQMQLPAAKQAQIQQGFVEGVLLGGICEGCE